MCHRAIPYDIRHELMECTRGGTHTTRTAMAALLKNISDMLAPATLDEDAQHRALPDTIATARRALRREGLQMRGNESNDQEWRAIVDTLTGYLPAPGPVTQAFIEEKERTHEMDTGEKGHVAAEIAEILTSACSLAARVVNEGIVRRTSQRKPADAIHLKAHNPSASLQSTSEPTPREPPAIHPSGTRLTWDEWHTLSPDEQEIEEARLENIEGTKPKTPKMPREERARRLSELAEAGAPTTTPNSAGARPLLTELYFSDAHRRRTESGQRPLATPQEPMGDGRRREVPVPRTPSERPALENYRLICQITQGFPMDGIPQDKAWMVRATEGELQDPRQVQARELMQAFMH